MDTDRVWAALTVQGGPGEVCEGRRMFQGRSSDPRTFFSSRDVSV